MATQKLLESHPVEMVLVDDLVEHPDNPRRGNVAIVAESIRANGFFGVVVRQKSTGFILAGNHRTRAARLVGLTSVPVQTVDVDDTTARRILLVDNRTNDLAEYDPTDLLVILGQLDDLFLQRVFDDAEHSIDQMIAVGPTRFSSICEHHLLPFQGTAVIAYIPTEGGVVGLSKLPRLLEHFARRPQVQERLTTQIGRTLEDHIPNQGVAVVVRASHSCASIRGVRREAPMTTSFLTGLFRSDPAARAEFFALSR